MTRRIILHIVTGFIVLCPLVANAKTINGKTPGKLSLKQVLMAQLITDTIPAPSITTEITSPTPETIKPVVMVIKEVPKARRVSIPKPVSVKIIPVKIIKPKIIKPVLKLF